MLYLFLIIATSFSLLTEEIKDCYCFQNVEDCKIGELSCKFEYTNTNLPSESRIIPIEADDTPSPFVAYSNRLFFADKTNMDIGFYGYHCIENKKMKITTTKLLWQLLPTDHVDWIQFDAIPIIHTPSTEEFRYSYSVNKLTCESGQSCNRPILVNDIKVNCKVRIY
jgi:hypothetical protein